MTKIRKNLFLLHESVIGYAVFRCFLTDEINHRAESVRKAYQRIDRFGRIVKLVGFKAFNSASIALENVDAIHDHKVTSYLKSFLKMTLFNKVNNIDSFQLGVYHVQLGSEIGKNLGIDCICNDLTSQLFRGIRNHFQHFVTGLSEYELIKAQLYVVHTSWKSQMIPSLTKLDNMIIQATRLTTFIDREIKNFLLRIREWYGWHFPELSDIVQDDYQYISIVIQLGEKSTLKEEVIHSLTRIVDEETKAREIFDASRMSTGQDISPIDIINIVAFAYRIVSLASYRRKLNKYLKARMREAAPNLSYLVGEIVGARLITDAGSLLNLAKYHVYSSRITGLEKRLYNVLKIQSHTSNYKSSHLRTFFTKCKKKKRLSRYLTNKCLIAARIDAFMDKPTNIFGFELKKQIDKLPTTLFKKFEILRK